VNISQEVCPVCDEGHLVPENYTMKVAYKDHTKELDGFERSSCPLCGAVVTNTVQSRNNKRIVLAYHKSVDGLLTGEQVKMLRKKYDLTQQDAAKLYGGGPVAFSKYENDEICQSEAMDTLLRLTMNSELAMFQLAALKSVSITPPRLNCDLVKDINVFKSQKLASNQVVSKGAFVKVAEFPSTYLCKTNDPQSVAA